MEVDPAPSTSHNKGKQPEAPIPPNNVHGVDESFDASENFLRPEDKNNNIINFAHEDDSPFFSHTAPTKNSFQPPKQRKDKSSQ